MRQKNASHRRQTAQRETNEKFLKSFSSHQLTDNQVSVISRGLKFIPTPVADETKIRHQLLQDFEQFARRMGLQYIKLYENMTWNDRWETKLFLGGQGTARWNGSELTTLHVTFHPTLNRKLFFHLFLLLTFILQFAPVFSRNF